MAQEFAEAFYRSRRWQKCRAAYIAWRRSVDGGMCERCREVPGYIVHHRIHLTPENIENPEIATSFDNLEYLCLACHNLEHNPARDPAGDLVSFEFGEDGEVFPLPPQAPTPQNEGGPLAPPPKNAQGKFAVSPRKI